MLTLARIAPETIPDSETVKAIYAAYVANRDMTRRPHLGPSIIGGPCERAQWYAFRHAKREELTGRQIRLFETGQREEERVAANLRAIGCEVWLTDENGKQFAVSDHNGHFVGHIDGVVMGLPEAPKAAHLLEVKTHNDKSFALLKTKGVASKPTHLAQMAVYMRMMGLSRAIYVGISKSSDEIYTERIRAEYTKDLADKMMARAKYIIESTVPPEKISDKSDHYECVWCPFHAVCHEGKTMDVTCRSCVHSTPVANGGWTCEHHGKPIDAAAQEAACDEHLFIPLTIGYASHTDAGVDSDGKKWVEYRNNEGGAFRNGPGPMGYSSKELATLPKELVGADHAINHGREAFGAKVVEFTPAAKKIIANASQSTRNKNLKAKAELGEKMTIEEERAEFAAWTKAVNLDMDRINL